MRSNRDEKQRKVLLVDDDAVSLEVMAILLAHEGHQVVRANDAGSALELLSGSQNPRPDVLLVDLQMPGVTGGQLAEQVRALDGFRPLMLAMSATEAQRAQLVAFDGFLLKPVAVEALRKALQPGRRARNGSRIGHRGKTAKPSTEEAVDIAVIEKLLTMMPLDALQDTIAACISDTRTCVRALQGQVSGDGVRRLAHRIKGAASMIGAVRLARLAAGLEMGGGKEAATSMILNDLLNACNELERMLLAGNLTKP
jgi:CheY-like chemotaxis protein/HPt (histidine-containing phosphotransfer) domain-containing protein